MSSAMPVCCFLCFQCNTAGTYSTTAHGSYLATVVCSNKCSTTWHICLLCKSRIRQRNVRTHISSVEHNRRIVNSSSLTSPRSPPLHQQMSTTKLPWDKSLLSPNIFNCVHLPIHSQRFFDLEIQQPGLGMRHIICKAFTGSTESASFLTKEEISLHLDIIQQCIANSRKSNTKFARILRNIISALLSNPTRPTIVPNDYHQGVIASLQSDPQFTASQLQAINTALTQETNRVVSGCPTPYNIFRVTRLPTKYSEIRKVYLEGKDAIIPNLPCPKARMLEDGVHAYISPLEIVSHYLAWGQGNQTHITPDPEQRKSVKCYHNSMHAQTIKTHVNSTIDINSDIRSFPLILFLTD
jgi:hypothetical protein